jgi:hypothetical protein
MSVAARLFDLGVFSFDLLDEQTDMGPALGAVQSHQLGPGPMEVIGEEEDLLTEAVLA